MKQKLSVLSMTATLVMTSPALGNNSCAHISGSYPQCRVNSSIDPEVEISISDVQIVNTSETDFTLSMMLDGTSTTEIIIADGKERTEVGEEGPSTVRAVCENNELVVHTKTPFGDAEVEGSTSFSKKNGVLTITQSLFDDIWQITSCR